jgi:hypothetical protein
MRARAIVAAGFLALLFLIFGGATAARADTYPVQPPPSVLSIEVSPPAVAPVAAAPAVQARGGLALTGADIIGMVLLGAGLVGIGFAVRQVGRRLPAV